LWSDSVPAVAEFSDQLRFKVGGVEVVHLTPIGTVQGVQVVHVAAMCGVGTGTLKSESAATLRWKAPGSVAYGEAVPVGSDGSYLLLDADRDKWVRVTVDVSELQSGIVEANVQLYDRYNNDVGQADITAAEATAGDTLTWTFTVENAGTRDISDVRVWIDAAVSDIDISDDGATWVTPTTEDAGLVLADLAPAATDTLHVRRVIGAGAASSPRVTNILHARFYGH
jgi:hypothetical protein